VLDAGPVIKDRNGGGSGGCHWEGKKKVGEKNARLGERRVSPSRGLSAREHAFEKGPKKKKQAETGGW